MGARPARPWGSDQARRAAEAMIAGRRRETGALGRGLHWAPIREALCPSVRFCSQGDCAILTHPTAPLHPRALHSPCCPTAERSSRQAPPPPSRHARRRATARPAARPPPARPGRRLPPHRQVRAAPRRPGGLCAAVPHPSRRPGGQPVPGVQAGALPPAAGLPPPPPLSCSGLAHVHIAACPALAVPPDSRCPAAALLHP